MRSENEQNRKIPAAIVAVACFAVMSIGYTLCKNSIVSDSGNADNAKPELSATTETTGSIPDSNKPENTAQTTETDDITACHETEDSGKHGKYTMASERILTEDDLAGLSSKELKIMRNEIYARHGFIFKTKSMKEYFTAQPWYKGKYNDVSSMLSDIEIKNVEFIKKHE